MREFLIFGLKQCRACVFAGSFLVLLFLSHYVPQAWMPRYDFLFIAAVIIQYVLYKTGLETKDEMKVIFLFHIVGLCLELFKTHPSVGSWSYPEFGYLKIASVPLYSGFMYAAVGSYISQAWKIFKLRLGNFTRYAGAVVLSVLIYANFFTNHFVYDMRAFLILMVFGLFWNIPVYFTVRTIERNMPLTLAFALIAFFIWVAENIGTYGGAWKYPYQLTTWEVVSLHKVSSWFLLVIISFIIVAYLKQVKANLESTKSIAR